jgi:hypothetical protein
MIIIIVTAVETSNLTLLCFICSLFNDITTNSDYVALEWLLKNELQWMCSPEVVEKFGTLFRYLPEGTERNREESLDSQ